MKMHKETPCKLFETSAYDTHIVALAQGFRFNKVGVQVSEEKGEITVRSYRSYIPASQLEGVLELLRQKPPQGTVILNRVDTISAEVCNKRGFRTDGKGLYKTFCAVLMANDVVSIVSTLQPAVETPDGEIVPDISSAYKSIEVLLSLSDTLRLFVAMYSALMHYQSCRQVESGRRDEWRLDIV